MCIYIYNKHNIYIYIHRIHKYYMPATLDFTPWSIPRWPTSMSRVAEACWIMMSVMCIMFNISSISISISISISVSIISISSSSSSISSSSSTTTTTTTTTITDY